MGVEVEVGNGPYHTKELGKKQVVPSPVDPATQEQTPPQRTYPQQRIFLAMNSTISRWPTFSLSFFALDGAIAADRYSQTCDSKLLRG